MGWFIVWIICAVISGAVGSSKGRAGMGWGLGLLLGPIGLLIVAVMPANAQKVEASSIESGEGKKCPYCAEVIKREAKVCRFCGKDQPESRGATEQRGPRVRPGHEDLGELSDEDFAIVRDYGKDVFLRKREQASKSTH